MNNSKINMDDEVASDNPFSQSEMTFKLSFQTLFCHLDILEDFINQNFDHILQGISTYEIESKTIESLHNDIWKFEAYFNTEPDYSTTKNLIDKFAQKQSILILDEITFEKIEDQDWISLYQNSIKPIEIGNFFISSKIHKNLCPKDKVGIYIDASRAFGTGEHATTIGCIEAMLNLKAHNFKNIIDVGTGTGILSFIAEKLWPKAKILGCDIEEVAIEIAKDNGNFNNSEVSFYVNSGDQIITQDKRLNQFDLIVSNILAGPLINFAGSFKTLSNKGTYIIISGFLENQTHDVLESFEHQGFELVGQISKGLWQILSFRVKEN